MNEKDLITEAEAARLIGKSPMWLHNRRVNKQPCPPHVIVDGMHIKYIKEDVLNWANDTSRFVKVYPNEIIKDDDRS